MNTKKCSEGRDAIADIGKDNQHRPKPSTEIVPGNFTNVKLLLDDFADAWQAYQQRERGASSVSNLLGFLAWFHEELEAAGAFGEVAA